MVSEPSATAAKPKPSLRWYQDSLPPRVYSVVGLILSLAGGYYLLLSHIFASMGIQANDWTSLEKQTLWRMFTGSMSGITYSCLILLLGGAGFLIAGFLQTRNDRHRQQAAVAAIEKLGARVVYGVEKLGARVVYDYQCDAQDNEIPNASPSGPAWLRRLLGDDVFRNVIEVSFPSGFGGFGSDLSDADLMNIKDFAKLRRLTLGAPKVTDGGLEYIRSMINLKKLDLTGTRITDAGLDILGHFTQLESLGLGGTLVTDAGLPHLRRLSQLKLLELDNTQITDAGMQYLEAFTQLQSLYLGRTRITSDALKHLEKLSFLKCLQLQGTDATDAGVAKLQLALPNCRIER